MITDEYNFAVPIKDQPSNEALTLIQDEIQSILVDKPTQESGMILGIVDPILVMQGEENQVHIILMDILIFTQLHDSEMVTYEVTGDKYYEVFFATSYLLKDW